ncbi:MAG TPA: glycosyltransferase family 4 protein [Nitrososphaerales archaeon]|nr:glycosyltransferase family 4 protein [Nitrososphaerales archaeon]
MKGLKICVNSQTPFIKFLHSYPELIEKYGTLDLPVKIENLEEGVDYQLSPGGVTAMLYPILKLMQKQGAIQDPIWVSLGSNAPEEVLVDHIRLNHVQLSDHDQPRYANFKESIWNEIHGVGKFGIKPEEYEAFIRYNWLSAQIMLKMLQDTDLYFIHDFQQLLTGGLIGPSAPAILRWHIPFNLESVSQKLKTFVLKNIEGFDSVIVSTRRDLEGLIRAGYRGRAYQIYPHVDRTFWTQPRSEDLQKLMDEYSLKDWKLLVNVARMDPIKGQDVAIRALSHVLRVRKDVKLLLIGNGSFSSSSKGGLGHSKGELWKGTLKSLVKELKLEDRVIFTGYLDQALVRAALSIADISIVPSKSEGFALTTVESWLYKKPVIVSTGAGSSEIVNDGINGYVFKSENDQELSEKILSMLSSEEAAIKMGESGYDTTSLYDLDRTITSHTRVFEETLSEFG